jgi:tetratricopeptide (TPR) repeat protein
MNLLAHAYRGVKMFEKGLALLEQTLAHCKEKLGPDHDLTLMTMSGLAGVYLTEKMPEKAIPLYEQVLAKYKEDLSPGKTITLQAMNGLAKALLEVKQPDKALPLFREFLDGQRKRWGADSPQLANWLGQSGLDLMQHKQDAEAEKYLRECLAIREKTQPDVWSTFNMQSLLGGALLGQKKYAEAEPLLRKGYEGMKQRETMIPAQSATRIPEALDRLIELYTVTNRPEEAKKWLAERVKYPSAKK